MFLIRRALCVSWILVTPACAQKPKLPQDVLLAGTVATEVVLGAAAKAANHVGLYATPLPQEQPIELMVARVVYTDHAELFQALLRETDYQAGMLAKLSDESDFADTLLSLSVKADVATKTEFRETEEKLEIRLNDSVTSGRAAELVKASRSLKNIAQSREMLKRNILAALKRHPEQFQALSVSHLTKPSPQLAKSRQRVQSLFDIAGRQK
jgi:hypothetical protein